MAKMAIFFNVTDLPLLRCEEGPMDPPVHTWETPMCMHMGGILAVLQGFWR
eukprot:NODE_4135_length_360_cov_5.913183_g3551_i0.p3 GENE.NODE_4135_length_360_cov_5.913183_g3551_i0~~NODE_4135_length_360_cov_5.913183_g3551_i0.p3  ORF type:complete len:51 (+),score=9.33 NODE_4135_length_360_cov_5.913183_g3551_i0:137-289(+)